MSPRRWPPRVWRWLELRGDAGDAAQAGRALRACHDALLEVDPAPLSVEPLAMLTEAQRLAARAPAEVGASRAWRSV
jgi:hypothetical protein